MMVPSVRALCDHQYQSQSTFIGALTHETVLKDVISISESVWIISLLEHKKSQDNHNHLRTSLNTPHTCHLSSLK